MKLEPHIKSMRIGLGQNHGELNQMINMIIRVMFIYIISRILVTLFLLVMAGSAKNNIIYDTFFFGGVGGGVVAACCIIFYLFLMLLGMRADIFLKSIAAISLVLYLGVNFLFILLWNNNYFILTIFQGIKYEIIFIAIYFCMFVIGGLIGIFFGKKKSDI